MKTPCHPAPSFGCPSCVENQRTAWALSVYNAWAATYRAPKCEGCGCAMEPYGYEWEKGKLVASVVCGQWSGDGELSCEGEYDFYVPIENWKPKAAAPVELTPPVFDAPQRA